MNQSVMTQEERFENHPSVIMRLDERLQVREFLYPKDDLEARIRNSKCVVVDRNPPWAKISMMPENRDTIFVVGRTVLDEEETIEHFFKEKMFAAKNIVLMVPYPDNNGFEIHLHLLDEVMNDILSAESRNAIKDKTEKYQQWRKTRLSHIAFEKQEILKILRVNDIAELGETKLDNIAIIRQLAAYIMQYSPRCHYHYGLAAEVARRCYAVLLAANFGKIRKEFQEGKINVFGDTMILQNALFMNAGILTGDKALIEMAGYGGVEVMQVAC